ncbi:MJ1477/TM1410 family putative glycoside hydrolase [Devosia albogilva]|uniref:MJ1477/TM1410 family putative glycoside hydrolase n=1 Tax=Devosia albogilva TaxID=429726 RepID=A0ABW5QNG1_9HYPH
MMLAVFSPTEAIAEEPMRVRELSAATSWIYQLQDLVPSRIARSAADVAVVDFAQNGSTLPLDRNDVARMRLKPDGTRRIVLAYLSIGEAEDYRFYWHRDWRYAPPDWLGEENPEWPGNYHVDFWHPQWQAILFGGPNSYLDQIQSAGFDGVYLDRVDAFAEGGAQESGKDRMRELVGRLSAYARMRNPAFLVVAQNGEELLADPEYRRVLDGFAKEDLFYGVDGDGVPNSKSEIRASLRHIMTLLNEGKPVFLVEYLRDPTAMATATGYAKQLGVPIYFAQRELDDVYALSR